MVRIFLATFLCACVCFQTLAAEIPDVVMQRAQSVCKIRVCNAVGSCSYLGNGYWLTNRHVVCSCGKASIHFKNGNSVSGQTVIRGTTVDLALVKTGVVNLDPIPLSNVKPEIGEIVYPTGYDFGKTHYIWPAKTTERWNSSRAKYVGVDSRKGPIVGNSGGPVLNARGELVAALRANSGGSNRVGTGSTLDVGFDQTRDFLTQFFQRRGDCPNGQCPRIQGGYLPGVVVPKLPKSEKVAPNQKTIPVVPVVPRVIDVTPKLRKDPPPEATLDIEQIKADLLKAMAGDERFRGPVGPRGPKGDSAAAPPVDVDAIVQRVKAEILRSLRVRTTQ